jgi:hypothetical protein
VQRLFHQHHHDAEGGENRKRPRKEKEALDQGFTWPPPFAQINRPVGIMVV